MKVVQVLVLFILAVKGQYPSTRQEDLLIRLITTSQYKYSLNDHLKKYFRNMSFSFDPKEPGDPEESLAFLYAEMPTQRNLVPQNWEITEVENNVMDLLFEALVPVQFELKSAPQEDQVVVLAGGELQEILFSGKIRITFRLDSCNPTLHLDIAQPPMWGLFWLKFYEPSTRGFTTFQCSKETSNLNFENYFFPDLSLSLFGERVKNILIRSASDALHGALITAMTDAEYICHIKKPSHHSIAQFPVSAKPI